MAKNLDQRTTDASEFLYHYTSLSSFMGILQCNGAENEHKDKLCFWGSRFDCMNDAIDCQYALQLPMKIYKKNNSGSEPARTIFPYVVSFCKKEDYLSMWRLYSSYVCLKFDKSILEKKFLPNHTECVLHDCKYEKNNISAIYSLFKTMFIVDRKTSENTIWENAQCAASFIKHESFKEEDECRLVYFSSKCKLEIQDDLTIFGNKVKIQEMPNDICFRTEGNNVIPYHKFYVHKEALKGVIVREYDDEKFERVKEHIKLVFQKRGINVKDGEIVKSSACKIN